jgi:hypothetical protein
VQVIYLHLSKLAVDSYEAKICPPMIIHQAHSGKELCRHIVKQLTLTATQSSRRTVFIRLKMMGRGIAINPLKTT